MSMIKDESSAARLRLPSTGVQGGDLSGVALGAIDFKEVDIRGWALRGADLRHAMNVSPATLAGCDLTGALLPPSVQIDSSQITDGTKAAQRLIVTMLVTCAYSLLTVFSTHHAQILANSTSSPLPVLQTTVPIVGFYVMTPLILLGLFVYCHGQLTALWRMIANSPLTSPDGTCLVRAADTWIGEKFVAVNYLEHGRITRSGSKLEAVIFELLAFWLVPVSLLAFWYVFLLLRRFGPSAYHLLITTVSIVLALHLSRQARQVLGRRVRAGVELPEQASATASRSRVIVEGTAVAVAMLALTLGAQHPRTPRGLDLRGAKLASSAMARSNLQFADLWRADLTGADLRGARLDGAVLNGASLREVHAAGASLRNCDLTGTSWNKAELDGCDLAGARLPLVDMRRLSLRRAILNDADLRGATLIDSDLRDATCLNTRFCGIELESESGDTATPETARKQSANLSRADLRSATLVGADFRGAVLSGARMESARFFQPGFQPANFTFANMDRIEAAKANMRRAVLKNASLKNAHANYACFCRADLSFSELDGGIFQRTCSVGSIIKEVQSRGVNLALSNLNSVDMSHCEFQRIILAGCSFRSATIIRCTFGEGGDLSGVDLSESSLRYVTFYKCDLSDAKFRNAMCLTDTDFEGSDLTNVDFSGADVRGARFELALNLSAESVWDAENLELATWPDDVRTVLIRGGKLRSVDRTHRSLARRSITTGR